jgi:hypothetical protein
VNLNAQPDAAVGVSIFGSLIQTTHNAGLPLTVTNISRDLLGPRFGFSWRPFGEKTVIRGGMGQYYQIESTNLRLNFNFIPFDFTQTVNATTNVVPTQTYGELLPGSGIRRRYDAGQYASILGSATRVREDGKQCALELWLREAASCGNGC